MEQPGGAWSAETRDASNSRRKLGAPRRETRATAGRSLERRDARPEQQPGEAWSAVTRDASNSRRKLGAQRRETRATAGRSLERRDARREQQPGEAWSAETRDASNSRGRLGAQRRENDMRLLGSVTLQPSFSKLASPSYPPLARFSTLLPSGSLLPALALWLASPRSCPLARFSPLLPSGSLLQARFSLLFPPREAPSSPSFPSVKILRSNRPANGPRRGPGCLLS